MIKRVFLSCLLAYSSITFAANVDYHKEFDKCTNDKQNIEVLGRNLTGGCASLVVDDTKKEMNKIYQKISSKKSEDENWLAKFNTAQKAWIAFREAECDFQSMELYSPYECLMDMNIERVKYFRNLEKDL